jgi:hypothetical protein
LYAADRNLRSADRARLAALVTDLLVTAVAERGRRVRRTIAA